MQLRTLCTLFLVLFFHTYTLGFDEKLQQQVKHAEFNFEKLPDFRHLDQLIDVYLKDSKYEQAEKILLKYNVNQLHRSQMGRYYLLLARTYKYEIKFDLAISTFEKAIKLADHSSDQQFRKLCRIEYMEFFRKAQNYPQALKLADELQYKYGIEKSTNDTLKNHFYNRYAAILNEQAKLDSSLYYSQKALALAKKINDTYAQAVSYNEIGFSYKNKKMDRETIEYYERAYDLWYAIGCYRDAVHARRNYIIYLSHNDLIPFQRQIELNKNLIALIDSFDIAYPQSDIYRHIEFAHMSLKNWKDAYLYRTRADSCLDFEQREANVKLLKELEAKFENEKLQDKNRAYQQLAKEKQDKLSIVETRFWLIFTFSMFSLIIIIVLYVLWQKNRKQNRKLIEQNIQKTFLIQEVHHRVKNNLQFVKSILSFQESLDELSAQETIEDISRRIDAMSMVHEMLYTENDQLQISVKEYMEKLMGVSNELYNHSTQIVFEMDIDDIFLSLEEMLALGIICSELLVNSVKHVFIHSETPVFSVKMKKQGADIKVAIRDNGQELARHQEDKRYRLGMRMIEIFLRQLNASMQLNRQHGYEMVFEFRPAAP